jgi:hypothetical protein
MLGSSSVAAQLAASQERLSYMKFSYEYSSSNTSASLCSVLNEQNKEEILTELVRGYGHVRREKNRLSRHY